MIREMLRSVRACAHKDCERRREVVRSVDTYVCDTCGGRFELDRAVTDRNFPIACFACLRGSAYRAIGRWKRPIPADMWVGSSGG